MVADMTSANEAEDVSTAARPPKLRTFDLTLMDHPRLGAALSYCRCSYQIVLGAILCDHGLRGPDALSDSDVGWTRSRSSGPLRSATHRWRGRRADSARLGDRRTPMPRPTGGPRNRPGHGKIGRASCSGIGEISV